MLGFTTLLGFGGGVLVASFVRVTAAGAAGGGGGGVLVASLVRVTAAGAAGGGGGGGGSVTDASLGVPMSKR